MRHIFTLSLFIFLHLSLFSAGKEEPITLETKTGNIKGTLLRPTADEKIPVVLIISGSGPTDRNGNPPGMINNSLKMLAEDLMQHGITSVRYDKRGVGESRNAAINEKDLRFENYIEDASAWVDVLNNDPRFSEIIIAGHSEGSLIGMIVARKKAVDKFISLAGVGSPIGDILKELLKNLPPSLLEQSINIIDKLEQGETTDSVPQSLYMLFRPSIQPYLISWLKYNPQQEIAKLKKPVLIIQGTTDIQVAVAEANKLAEANKKAEKHIIEGMNHILKPAEADREKNIKTYSDPDLPLMDGLTDLICNFILNHN